MAHRGHPPGPNTRRLLVEHGGFHYDRDALNDELPCWVTVGGMPHLVIPYSYETNDNRCDQSNGFAQSDDFFQYMRDAFDLLHEEGADKPGLLSIGPHDRLIGRPARAVGLIKLLKHMWSKGDVWFCTGADIASHWRQPIPIRRCPDSPQAAWRTFAATMDMRMLASIDSTTPPARA